MTIKDVKEEYKNKYIELEVYEAVSNGKYYPSNFHTDNCRSLGEDSPYGNYTEDMEVGLYELMDEEEYKELFNRIRPEIIELAKSNQEYWTEKYSPLIGDIQDWIYDLYLKGNKIQSGRKNYSEVVGLLISYYTHCNK